VIDFVLDFMSLLFQGILVLVGVYLLCRVGGLAIARSLFEFNKRHKKGRN
jgi:hypothetical protein